ncbi:MAG TPA: hypothetical protein DIT25_03055 [Candidatus Moranbacteria bacterium]|nr:hypothetical protein [Candidatus Moranbacteria bacterium]
MKKKIKKRTRKRDFLKEKSTIRKLSILIMISAFALGNISAYAVLNGDPLTLAKASQTVGLSQQIMPLNPVQQASNLEKAEADKKSLGSSEYRMVSEVRKDSSDSKEEAKKVRYISKSPIITFQGKTIYPNADIILEIHSETFFASTKSDSQGNWSWTNWGHPLPKGDHSVEAYSISPFELSGKRDVFAEKYFFIVDGADGKGETETMHLDKSDYVAMMGDGDLGDKLASGDARSVYIFDAMLVNKKSYDPGDVMVLQMLFNPMGKNSQGTAKVNYQLYYYGENEAKAQLAADLEENRIEMKNGGAFLKKIALKKDIMTGGYFLKVTADIGGDKYVQSLKFEVSDKVAVQVGGLIMTHEKLSKALVWNIIIILLIVIGVMVVVMFEFKRFLKHPPIESGYLKKKGFFAK